MRAGWLFAGLMVLAGSASAQQPLLPFHRGSWQALREAHHDQPLIVHFWGLTCGPCLQELPAWGELAHERPGAALVTVAADPYPMQPGAISATLEKTGLARTENWMFDSLSERLRWEVDPTWQGELPLTIMVAADGTVQTTLGAADMKTVRDWLDHQPRR